MTEPARGRIEWWSVAVAGALALGACAAPTPAPPLADPAGESEPLDLEGAAKLIAEVEASWPTDGSEALRAPKTVEDALQILKRDQLTLFPGAVALLSTMSGLEAKALDAQLELAWGEAYMVVMSVLQRLGDELGKGERTPELEAILSKHDRYAEAFQLLSISHLTQGSAKADEVIAAHPDSYLGYRLAADYYRTVRDWEAFDRMVSKLEALNPKSNGLVFLRGTAAYARDRDVVAASRWFETALSNDAAFLRARAHLVMIQPDLDRLRSAYRILKDANPSHQLVRYCEPLMARLEAAR